MAEEVVVEEYKYICSPGQKKPKLDWRCNGGAVYEKGPNIPHFLRKLRSLNVCIPSVRTIESAVICWSGSIKNLVWFCSGASSANCVKKDVS